MVKILALLLLIPVLCVSQSIQFQHNYNVFGVEEAESDTFSIRLSSLPSASVTVVISCDNGLISFVPDTLIFTTGNYNDYQQVILTAGSTPEIDEVRSATVYFAAFGGGYDAVTLNRTLYIRERFGDFVVWVIGDPHLGTDMGRADPYNGVLEAVEDFKDAQGGGERLTWDIAICVGDIAGTRFEHITGEESTETIGPYAGQGIGRIWRETFTGNGIDINTVYTIAGNHDGGDTLQNIGQTGGMGFINQYLDPYSENMGTSGINPDNRPYPVTKHRKDIGSFSVGNLLFVLIHDRNDAKFPAGRSSVADGHPAGTYTMQAIHIFDSLVTNNPQATVIGVGHHLLEGTTTYTRYMEENDVGVTTGTAHGIHGDHGALDVGRGSYAAIVWDENADYNDPDAYITYDGVNLDGDTATPPVVGFKRTLQDRHDRHLWLAGHTHPFTTAYDAYNDREMAVFYDKSFGVVNCGSLTRFHGQSRHNYSRIFHFYEGEKIARMQTYTHTGVTISGTLADMDQLGRVITKGINDDLEAVFEIETCFNSAYNATQQYQRGNCAQCN